MASKRGNPIARVGNYAAPIDTAGIDESMKNLMLGTDMDKVEKAYVEGKGNSPSSIEAVRRARRANKRPPLKESY